jgi:hypothetical protein
LIAVSDKSRQGRWQISSSLQQQQQRQKNRGWQAHIRASYIKHNNLTAVVLLLAVLLCVIRPMGKKKMAGIVPATIWGILYHLFCCY